MGLIVFLKYALLVRPGLVSPLVQLKPMDLLNVQTKGLARESQVNDIVCGSTLTIWMQENVRVSMGSLGMHVRGWDLFCFG
jgi:hypothetical protein